MVADDIDPKTTSVEAVERIITGMTARRPADRLRQREGLSMTVESYASGPRGLLPNSRFPLLIHRGGIAGGGAEAVLERFRGNGWLHNWRYPRIYDYPHFHSTTHECLGVASG